MATATPSTRSANPITIGVPNVKQEKTPSNALLAVLGEGPDGEGSGYKPLTTVDWVSQAQQNANETTAENQASLAAATSTGQAMQTTLSQKLSDAAAETQNAKISAAVNAPRNDLLLILAIVGVVLAYVEL